MIVPGPWCPHLPWYVVQVIAVTEGERGPITTRRCRMCGETWATEEWASTGTNNPAHPHHDSNPTPEAA